MQSSTTVVVLSIRPEYVARILAATKQVEFRRQPLPAHVTHAVVYATMPVGRLVATFTIAGQVTAPPSRLWAQYQQVAGIEQERFDTYYQGRRQGTAILIKDLVSLPAPVPLSAVGLSHAPQSWRYLPDPAAHRQLLGLPAG